MLSRRAVLEEERKEQRQEILDRLQPGLVVEGQISNIVDFGAFVDLNGIDGLIHISELSWSHVNHPSEILNIGDTVQVKVLDIDRDRQRISLGLKQTQEDPWQRVVDTYNVGDELEGAVTKVVTFGAFVEILDGVEGLVHISELATHHVENPREIVQPGDEVRVKILEIDSERRRLSLSVKRVEGQVLPSELRAQEAAAERRGDQDVPELGLSEDVFAGEGEAAGEGAEEAVLEGELPSRGRGRHGGRGGRRGGACRRRARRGACRRGACRRGAAAEEPAAEEPAAEEPAAEEPAAEEPAAEEPAAEEPAAEAPGPRTPRPPRRTAPEADAASEARPPRSSSRPRGRARPVRRAHRWPRRRQVDRAGRARAPGRGDALDRRRRPRPVRSDEVRDAVVGRWGDDVAPGGVVDRAAVARQAFADPRERAWLEGLIWPRVAQRVVEFTRAGSRSRPAAASRSSWRPRCCSRPAWKAPTTRRSPSSPTRTSAHERAAGRGHAALDERAARQLTQEEKARGPPTSCATTAASRSSSASWPTCLPS